MNTEPNATNILHENNNFLVTEEGELFQKGTSLFKGRKLGTIDTENLDEALEPFIQAFSELEKKVTGKIDEIESLDDLSEISRHFEDLIEQVKNADAIGDFADLIQKIQVKQDELLKTDEAKTAEVGTNSEEKAEVASKPTEEEQSAVDKNQSEKTDPDASVSVTEDDDSVSAVSDTVEEKISEEKKEETSEAEIVESADEKTETVAEPVDENQPEETDPVESDSKTEDSVTTDTEELVSDTVVEEIGEDKKENASEAEVVESSTDEKTEADQEVSVQATEEKPAETETEEIADSEIEKEVTISGETDESEDHKESAAEEATESPADEGLNLDFDVPDELSVYHEIIEKGYSLLHGSDIQYANMEFDNLRRKWSEGPAVEEEQQEIYSKLNDIFNGQQKEFQNRKSAHYDEIHQKKIKNLERKNDLLSRLKSIIEQRKWHALNEVQGIQKRWDNIRLIDSQEAEPINRQYNALIEEYEKNRVEYLVARKEKEEQNHTLKLTILDKISTLLNRIDENFSDWKALDREYNELLREWKKVGRVPREKASEIWQRYKDLRSSYYDKKLTYDTSYRNEVEKRYAKKQELVKEAQTLAEAEDLAQAARSINKLHKRWKDVGALPKEQSEELWTQFKAATDAFNERKAENIDLLRDQENDNYETKVKLCEEAESIKDSDNWKDGTNRMQELMDQWKAVGPVPRRKTRKIWRRFKKAMDEFYDRKRDFFKEERQKQKENLKQKRDIIEQIFALGDHEDPIEARELIKPLQKAFSDIGFVPIKQKNKIYKQYREACDVVYQRARAADRGGPILSKQAVLSHDDRRELRDKQNLFNKLRKECEKLNELILSYSDSQTFIRPNKQGLKLRNEIQEKIDQAKEELESKQEKVEELRQEIEEIRNGESS